MSILKEKFLEKARLKYGDRHDYSLVEYVNNKTPIKVICKIHGEFLITPVNYLCEGVINCKKCSLYDGKDPTQYFIDRVTKIYNGLYDYSRVKYISADDKVEILCKIHNSFYQTPREHLVCGCPKCGRAKRAKNITYTTEKFIEKAREKYGDAYTYEAVEYVKHDKIVKINCPRHGIFEKTPHSFLRSDDNGCRKCSEGKRKMTKVEEVCLL